MGKSEFFGEKWGGDAGIGLCEDAGMRLCEDAGMRLCGDKMFAPANLNANAVSKIKNGER